MGRIKELQDKQSKGELSDDEAKELKDLLEEAKAVNKEEGDEETTETTEDEDVDKLVSGLMSNISQAIDKKFESIESKLKADDDDNEEKMKQIKTKETPFIVDKSLGTVAVKQLDDVTIELPGRKEAGKSVTSVTGKTLHFLHALQTGDRQKLQILSEGTPADGGYLVPIEYGNMLIEDIRDASPMRGLATVMSTRSDTFKIPKLTARPQVQWRAEKATKATTTANFGEVEFTPYSLAAIVTLTTELEADATLGVNGSIINLITRLLTQSVVEKEDSAFFTGDGSNKPTGLTAATISSQAKGSNFADTIIDVFHSLGQGYRGRATWVGNYETLREVRKVKDNENRYLVQELDRSPFGTLLGRPIVEANSLGHGELYVGDFASGYFIVDREGISVDVSREATVGGSNYFEKNLVGVRVEKRTDGEVVLPTAFRKVTNI